MPRKYRVEITQAAQVDAWSIHDYIAGDSLSAAAAWLADLERQIRSLERFPLRCPVMPEARDLGRAYRHLICGNYRTVFRIEKSTVWIVRIVHGAQLLDTSVLEA